MLAREGPLKAATTPAITEEWLERMLSDGPDHAELGILVNAARALEHLRRERDEARALLAIEQASACEQCRSAMNAQQRARAVELAEENKRLRDRVRELEGQLLAFIA